MKNVRIILTVVFALGLVIGLTGLLLQQADYHRGEVDYAEAQEAAGSPADSSPSTEDEAGEPAVDLAALQAVNPDVIGWLAIPGTDISYPVVQGTDNEYYLTHTWKKEQSSVGAIFLDHRSDPGFSDHNTLIYGHRMRNGSMFAGLQAYETQDGWEAAPYLILTDAEGMHRYDIFAACQAKIDAPLYTPGADNRSLAEDVLSFAAEHNVLTTGISPSADTPILTLITCAAYGYSTRWVVQAALAEG